MSNKKSKKKARGLMVQAEIHKAIFSEDNEEAIEYDRQAEKIIKKAELKFDTNSTETIKTESQKEFCRRLKAIESGRKTFHSIESNLLYHVLLSLSTPRNVDDLIDLIDKENPGAIIKILDNLLFCKYVKKDIHVGIYSLTPKGKNFVNFIKTK